MSSASIGEISNRLYSEGTASWAVKAKRSRSTKEPIKGRYGNEARKQPTALKKEERWMGGGKSEDKIASITERLYRPNAASEEAKFKRQQKASQEVYEQTKTLSFMSEKSKEVTEGQRPLVDRVDEILERRSSERDREILEQRADLVKTMTSSPKITNKAKQKRRTVADLLRWQQEKDKELSKRQKEAEAEQLALCEQRETQRFKSRCDQVVSTERLYKGQIYSPDVEQLALPENPRGASPVPYDY